MAIYHCSIKNISRGKGQNVVASASYRSGQKLHDERLGKNVSYNKPEVIYSNILAPDGVPAELLDREKLWNTVEKMEKRDDARLAKEFEVSIPHELTKEQGIELVNNFASGLVAEGMICDIDIHWKNGNHHAHILTTDRPFRDGKFQPKEKSVFARDENGNKIPVLDENGNQKYRERKGKGREMMWKRTTEDCTGWTKKEKLKEWRRQWQDLANIALEKAGSKERIDCRSYKAQGLKRKPKIYMGKHGKYRKHINQEIEQINKEIEADNKEIEQLEKEIALAKKALAIQERIEDNERSRITSINRAGAGRTEADGISGNDNRINRQNRSVDETESIIRATQQIADRKQQEADRIERERAEAEARERATKERERRLKEERDKARKTNKRRTIQSFDYDR